jgi:transcriptional regulator
MPAGEKVDVRYGTLSLMILKTLQTMGPLHGYGLARRIEQISSNQLALNQGTLYPALLKLEQAKWIAGTWRQSENGRRAKFYGITAAGRKQLEVDTANWKRGTSLVARFLNMSDNPS